MFRQIKLDACNLFEQDPHDRDGVKLALLFYLIATINIGAILGVWGLVAQFAIEWIRAKKKPTSTPASEHHPTPKHITSNKPAK